jgi:DNA mismatch repair protein MutH
MVTFFQKKNTPTSEQELIDSCRAIEGLTFSQLTASLGLDLPENPNHRKGWIGQVIEIALGANAKNQALPDFTYLGIELKTLPIAESGFPSESTFVTSIPLLAIHHESWETSTCWAKLKRVLWIPVEGDNDIPYSQRRIGTGFLWSPNAEQARVLKNDWDYLTTQIVTGQLEMLDATSGDYLQVRPKGADGKSLCDAYDSVGNKIKTLPRGFYLRASFTASLL